MGLIFNGNGDVIKAVDGSLTVEGLDLGGVGNVNAGIATFSGAITVGSDTVKIDNSGIVASGIITATKFIGQADISGGSIVATTGTFSGDVSVGGVLTYEDVKNVDSVGIISARDGVKVTGGNLNVTSSENTLGILTSTDDGANLDLWDNDTQSRIRTVDGRLHLYADLGNDVADSAIRFFVDGTNERLRITSAGNVGIGIDNPVAKLDVAGKLLVGDSISHTNVSNALDVSAATGVTGFRPINLIDTSSVIKFARNHNDYGPALDFQHWNSDISTMYGRGLAGISSLGMYLTNVTEGGYIYFETKATGGSSTEKVRITGDGLVGIGTDDPKQPVHISRGSAIARIQSTNATTSARLEIIGANDSYSGLHMGDVDDVDVGAIRYYHGGSNPNHMQFKTAGSERLRITSAGEIGIGTDDPTDFVDIMQGSDAQNIVVVRGADDISEYAGVGVYGGNAVFTGGGVGSTSTGIVFRTAASGAETERLRITSAGQIGIGTDNPLGTLHIQSNNPSIKLTDSNQAVDNKSWNISAGNAQLLRIQAMQDGGGGGVQLFDFYRSGNKVEEFRGMKSGTAWFVVNNNNQRVGIGTDDPSHELEIWSDSPAIRLTDTSPYAVNQYGQIAQAGEVLQLVGRGNGTTHGGIYFYSQNDSEMLNAYRITDSYHLWYTANDSNIVKMRLHNGGQLQLDPNNTGPLLSNDQQALKIDTGNGYIRVGPTNTSYAHIYTDRAKFYLNKRIILDEGIISAYSDHDLVLTTGSSPSTSSTGICIKNSTNYVGIGTNIPGTMLHITDLERAQGADYATLSLGSPSFSLRRVEIGARRSTRGGDWDNVGIGFKVHPSNSYTDAPETKMVLDYDGNLGVGTSDPVHKLHLSSGTSGDCVLILEADTDNNQENDNAWIEFRQDGGIIESVIGQNPYGLDAENNSLVLANSINPHGGIIFKTGTSNGYTNATESMRIESGGDVGIGTDNATRGPLHINEQSNDDVQIHLTNNETGTTSSDGFTIFGGAGTNGRDMGFVNRQEGGAIEFLTNMGGTVAQRMALWTDNDIATLAINTAGDGIHSNLMISNHDTSNYHGTADRSEYPIYSDIHFSGDAAGANALTANRSKAGWRNDVEYTCTNAHSNTSGERMQLYGIHSTINATKYAYALQGAYTFAAQTADDLPRTGTVIGTYGYAQGYINSSSPTKSCNIYGGHFLGYRGGSTNGGHCYGVMGRAQQVTNGDGTKTGDMTGVYGEIEVDEGTVNTAYSVRAIVDVDDNTGSGHSASVLNYAYLFKGDYSVASNTTCTNRRGIWLNGCTDSYIQGDLDITGALSKGSGSFRISHPLVGLSTTKDLVHSFVEGPQCDLIYRGKVDLVGGTATVNIDTKAGMTEGTFVSLCRDIQCFTSNETGWTAVKGSVTGNKITIIAQDNSCTDTISWMVVGERQDDNIKASTLTDNDGNLIVEPDKKPVEEFEQPECEKNIHNPDPNHNPADDGKD